MDLFELLLKEDLWGKNIQMIKVKESFNYINNFIKFPLKVKHTFNLFELLINIEGKNYLTLTNFQDKIEKKEKRNDKLIFKESRKAQKMKEEKKDNKKEKENEEEEKNTKEKEDFKIKNAPIELLEDLKFIKKSQKYIYNLLKSSKIITKYIEEIKMKDKNNQSNCNIPSLELQNEILNHGRIFKEENLIKKFNYFVSNLKIDISISKLKEKKDIANFGRNINNIILFNKNKIIVAYNNERIKFYLFDIKSLRKETTFIPVEIKSLKEFKDLDKVKCMKELINGSLLLGTTNGNIINLDIKEIQKKNKSDFNVQLINQAKLDNSKSIIDLIEINNNTFISNDEDKNNIVWENFKIKKELSKGKIIKHKNILIIMNDSINFYDIKKDYEIIGKIDIKIINYAILNDDYMVGEDSNDYKFYIINIKEKKIMKEKDYEPHESFILKRICDEWIFKLKNDDKLKLINVKFIKDENNNSWDLIPDNKNSLLIDFGPHLITLFDEFFIVCKENGNINCYGCF